MGAEGMKKWSKRSADNLVGIHPDLRRVMDRSLQDSPIDFTVIEGLRTKERQAQLVKQGASKTMNSRHITGHAVDLWPTDPATGKAANGKNDKRLWTLYLQLAPAVKAAAKAEGVALVWGGDWKSFPDGPHFELDRKVYPAGKAPAGKAAPASAPAVTKPPTKRVADHKPKKSDPPAKPAWLAAIIAFFTSITKGR